MTAAYADDPTIAQEQNTEKRAVMASKTLLGKKEESNEDETGNPSAEIAKRATGGQDKDEIAVNREEETSRCALHTIDNQGSIGRRDKELACEELSEGSERSGNSRTIVTTADTISDIERLEIKIDEVVDRDSDARKSGGTFRIDAVLDTDDSRNASVTAEYDSSLHIVKQCDANDESKMQLHELRYSIESVSTQAKDLSNDFEIVKGESDEGSEVYGQLEDSYDPESKLNFHEAVRAGDAKCVAALLASGSVQNLDEPDWNVSGDPPLLVAATNHCLPVLSLLLSNGCDPAVRSPRGETALHRVILNGGPGNVFEFVGELLKYGCPPGVKEAGGGLTALHVLTRQLAHAQGSKNLHHNFEAALKTLDLLADAGPVNAKDHQGRSALHILTSSTIFDNSHRTEIESLIETLLTAGADPALKNDRGETPLHECLECGALNTAFLLTPHTPIGITSRYGETPLHIASRKNYADMVAKLLEHGEDPSVQDAGGNTPLHLASARGFHQTVSLLVTSPLAHLEKHNTDGLTALQVAAESGFVNAVRLLLKAGADPSQTVHYCTTTLHRHPDISVLINHELTRRRQLAA